MAGPLGPVYVNVAIAPLRNPRASLIWPKTGFTVCRHFNCAALLGPQLPLHLLVAGLLNLPGAGHASTIAVQKQADHHLWAAGRVAAALGVLITVDGPKIQLPDHIADKISQGDRLRE